VRRWRDGGLAVRLPDFSTRSRRSSASPSETALLGAGFLALALAAYVASSGWADLRVARGALETERREAAALSEKVRALESRGFREGGLSNQALLTAEAPPPRVLTDLSALLPADVRLDGIALTYGANLGIEARVVARRAASYDLFLKRLTESTAFGGIVPGSENRQGQVQASVQMVYRGAER
jgi:hypothetical protein